MPDAICKPSGSKKAIVNPKLLLELLADQQVNSNPRTERQVSVALRAMVLF